MNRAFRKWIIYLAMAAMLVSYSISPNGAAAEGTQPEEPVIVSETLSDEATDTTSPSGEGSDADADLQDEGLPSSTDAGAETATDEDAGDDAEVRENSEDLDSIMADSLVSLNAPSLMLAGDSFDAAPGMLHQADGGRGWSEPWFVQNADGAIPGYEVASHTPLSYPGLYQSGNYASGGKAYLTAYRNVNVQENGPFANYLNSGKIGKEGTTLWFSALLRKDQSNGDYVWYGTEAFNTKFAAGYFGAASHTDGQRYWSLEIDHEVFQSDVPVVIGEAALLVARIDYGSTDHQVSLYVNPASLGVEAPLVPDIFTTTPADLKFKNAVFYGGNSPGQGSMDELRLGTTFASVTPTSFDDVSPTPPTDVTSLKTTDSAVTLSWTASTDNVGVVGYFVYQDGVKVGETTVTSYTVKGLTRSTTYTFTVRAYDGEDNLSEPSDLFVVTTEAEPADNSLYNFENGELHGLAARDNTPATVTHDTSIAYAGEGSAKIQFTGQSTVSIDNVDPRIMNGKTVTFQVFIPSNVPDFSIQPMVFGAGWAWNGGWYDTIYLQKDKWNTLVVPFENGDAPSPRVGFNIHTANPGMFWVDSISYIGYGEVDTTPPTVPGNLKVRYKTDHVARLDWDASTDNEGVTGYQVYVGETEVGSTKNTTYTITGLEPATTYEVTVRASDAAGNQSEPSLPLVVTTDEEHQLLAGSVFGSEASGVGTDVDKAFDKNLNTYYESRYASGGFVGLDLGEGAAKRITKFKYAPRPNHAGRMLGGRVQGSDDGVEYSTLFTIRETPVEGWNEVPIATPQAFRYIRYLSPDGGYANVAEIEFYGEDGDVEPPTAPSEVTANNITETSAELSWTVSTDNVGVVFYDIYADSKKVGQTNGTSYTVRGLSPNRTYSFKVFAQDGSGNRSEPSEPLQVTTRAAVATVTAMYDANKQRVVIRGNVSSGKDQQVTIQVYDPADSPIFLSQVTSGFGGSFVESFKLTAPQGDIYEVTVGGVGLAAQGSAQLTIGDPGAEDPVLRVSPEQLQNAVNGQVRVELSGAVNELHLPLDAAQWLDSHEFVMVKGAAAVTLDARTFMELQKLADKERIQDGMIVIRFEERKEAAELQNVYSGNKKLTPASHLYSLEFIVQSNDGRSAAQQLLAPPAKVTITLDEGVDPTVARIYRFHENSGWQNSGWQNMDEEAHHPSAISGQSNRLNAIAAFTSE